MSFVPKTSLLRIRTWFHVHKSADLTVSLRSHYNFIYHLSTTTKMVSFYVLATLLFAVLHVQGQEGEDPTPGEFGLYESMSSFSSGPRSCSILAGIISHGHTDV